MALSLLAPFVWAQTTTTEEKTTTTTTSSGTITEFAPGQTIILKEEAGPKTYHFGKKVVYVTKSGKAISGDEIKTRIKVGLPVSVHYVRDGENMTVSRVVIED